MFTGIIEELGKVRELNRGSRQQRLTVECSKILEDIHIGDSIAVNGVCLTVIDHDKNSFLVDVMNETFVRSSLGSLQKGSSVNLERAMPSNGRFGGHIVSGHIDGTGRIRARREDGNAVWFEIKAGPEIMRYIVEKGSVAIDGISLTVAKATAVSFWVSIIPHTLGNTVLGDRRVGDTVNLENDIVAKYINKALEKEMLWKELSLNRL
ncbi:riboflavin synthase [Butyrivibrio sp. MC2013]|uniref:riboflavin synthase n=1 Tax=Butyrivibrio sp. MC2013 TaxID=1280686 RepID=UPI000419CD06|nr:riboflavin synthase [Butyrivibrio sp. MC2013]